MTLAMPADIKKRDDCVAIIDDFLRSVAQAIVVRVWQGQELCFRPNDDEARTIASRLSECSFVFIRYGSRGSIEPLAAFVSNRSMGTCKLEYLIDVAQNNAETTRRESEAKLCVGIYARMIFADNPWVDRVFAPFSWSPVAGHFDLQIAEEDENQLVLNPTSQRSMVRQDRVQQTTAPKHPKVRS